MLQFNPYFRHTPEEALQSEAFAKFNNVDGDAPAKVSLEIDAENAFNYEEGSSNLYTKQEYISLVTQVADKVHGQRVESLAQLHSYKINFNK